MLDASAGGDLADDRRRHVEVPLHSGRALRDRVMRDEHVPANRIGYGEFTGYQLKIIQECITLTVFVMFAWLYLGERIRSNYALSFLFSLGAVVSAFWEKL